MIGSNYTLQAASINAVPMMFDADFHRYTPAVRGLYRCDSFILDLFGFTNTPQSPYAIWINGGYYPIELLISGDPQDWKAKIKSLFVDTITLPYSVYQKIRSFQ